MSLRNTIGSADFETTDFAFPQDAVAGLCADDERMKILHELSWLWETLGIALVAAAVCMACAALIGKAAKKKLGKKVLAVIGDICSK